MSLDFSRNFSISSGSSLHEGTEPQSTSPSEMSLVRTSFNPFGVFVALVVQPYWGAVLISSSFASDQPSGRSDFVVATPVGFAAVILSLQPLQVLPFRSHFRGVQALRSVPQQRIGVRRLRP